jgi:hypothetical protein
MRRISHILAAIASTVCFQPARAQIPNFSGTWTPVPAQSTLGLPITIVQDSMMFSLQGALQENSGIKAAYKLDGTEGKNGRIEVSSRAKWDGPRLVVTSLRERGQGPVTSTIVYSLDPSGNLVIETTAPSMSSGGEIKTHTLRYQKTGAL